MKALLRNSWLILLPVLMGLCILAGSARAEGVSEIVVQTIAMEAADQSEYGQYLVASVIVNRARRAGNSLEWVVLRRSQFSCWNDREWARQWLGSHFSASTAKSAKKALEQAITAPFPGITHYHTMAVKPYWVDREPVIVEGSHKFYRGIK